MGVGELVMAPASRAQFVECRCDREYGDGNEHDRRACRKVEVVAEEEPDIRRHDADGCRDQHHRLDSSSEERSSSCRSNQHAEDEESAHGLETRHDRDADNHQEHVVEESNGKPRGTCEPIVDREEEEGSPTDERG